MRSAAFLRGINVGGRRVTNDELIAVFVDMGFTEVGTFLASGNVLFTHDSPADAGAIGAALEASLGFSVPTTLRSAGEIRGIAAREPFPSAEPNMVGGKPQVILLFGPPTAASQRRVLALAPPDDRLVFEGWELHWLPPGGISDSSLNLDAVSREVGPVTVRTGNTIARLLARL